MGPFPKIYLTTFFEYDRSLRYRSRNSARFSVISVPDNNGTE